MRECRAQATRTYPLVIPKSSLLSTDTADLLTFSPTQAANLLARSYTLISSSRSSCVFALGFTFSFSCSFRPADLGGLSTSIAVFPTCAFARPTFSLPVDRRAGLGRVLAAGWVGDLVRRLRRAAPGAAFFMLAFWCASSLGAGQRGLRE